MHTVNLLNAAKDLIDPNNVKGKIFNFNSANSLRVNTGRKIENL